MQNEDSTIQHFDDEFQNEDSTFEKTQNNTQKDNINFSPTSPSNRLSVSSHFQKCSVIIPFYIQNPDKHNIILTQRSKHLKSHPGQIGFPGGVQELGESLLETALREWEEEMGTPADSLQILGKYKDLITVTGYKITPFIAIYNGSLNFQLSEEVESAFLIPLNVFWEADFYCIDFNSGGRTRVYYFDLGERGLLWGATCEIIYQLLKETQGFNRTPNLTQANLPNPPFLSL